jgi:alpha/beta superfamily hydrolase
MKISDISKYEVEEIRVYNRIDRIVLTGSFITPKRPYEKMVIIVPGSGKDTRHSHHKLTKILLDNNIAVFRYDERGVGQSQGIYSNSITSLKSDLRSCIQYFNKHYREIRIGVLGHSLGGMTAVLNLDYTKANFGTIDFLIQLSVPIGSYSETCRYQLEQADHSKYKNKSKEEILSLFDSLIELVNQNTDKNTISIKEKGNYLIRRKNFELNNIDFWSESHISLYKMNFEKTYRTLKIPTIYIIGTEDKIVNPNSEIKHLTTYTNPNIAYYKLKYLDHFLTRFRTKDESIYNIHKSATDIIISWLQGI